MRTKPVALAILLALFAGGLVSATPVGAATLPPSEWVIGPRQKIVMLTFDGQARSQHLLQVLERLAEKNARSSFFMSGQWIRHHQKKARAVVLAGHSMGNRGYGTDTFTSLGDDVLRSSIRRAEQQLKEIGADPAPFLRFPRGRRDLRTLKVAGSLGYRSVRWTYRAGGGGAENVQRRVIRNLRSGSIIRLDPWRKSHRKALPGIIDGIRRKGYSLRTVDSLRNVHAVRWDVTLKSGSSGPEVYYLKKKLGQISYPSGKLDSSFGYSALQAVYAFEKVHRMTRDGVVTPAQMTAIALAKRPKAPKRDVKTFIDADISRQVVFEVTKGKVTHTTPMSSGNNEYYEVDGQRYRAVTPRGRFTVERKILGKRVSRLGTLYDPVYFTGGFAFHGSPSVPVYPASHGCIRLPMYVSRAFHNRSAIGKPVFVHD